MIINSTIISMLNKSKITCEQCSQYHTCCGSRLCRKFNFTNETVFYNVFLPWLRESTPKPDSENMKLKRVVVKRKRDTTTNAEDITPLDKYYIAVVNEALSDIRHGIGGHVFTLEQLRDVIRLEPNVSVVIRDGIFHITKSKESD